MKNEIKTKTKINPKRKQHYIYIFIRQIDSINHSQSYTHTKKQESDTV